MEGHTGGLFLLILEDGEEAHTQGLPRSSLYPQQGLPSVLDSSHQGIQTLDLGLWIVPRSTQGLHCCNGERGSHGHSSHYPLATRPSHSGSAKVSIQPSKVAWHKAHCRNPSTKSPRCRGGLGIPAAQSSHGLAQICVYGHGWGDGSRVRGRRTSKGWVREQASGWGCLPTCLCFFLQVTKWASSSMDRGEEGSLPWCRECTNPGPTWVVGLGRAADWRTMEVVPKCTWITTTPQPFFFQIIRSQVAVPKSCDNWLKPSWISRNFEIQDGQDNYLFSTQENR